MSVRAQSYDLGISETSYIRLILITDAKTQDNDKDKTDLTNPPCMKWEDGVEAIR